MLRKDLQVRHVTPTRWRRREWLCRTFRYAEVNQRADTAAATTADSDIGVNHGANHSELNDVHGSLD